MKETQARTRSGDLVVLRREELEALAARLRGRLCTPDDEHYDALRRLWNGLVDKRPAVIVRCRGVADVIQAVQFAAERRLLLAVRGGGHNVAGSASCDEGLVIDLSEMRSVRVDPQRRTVRAEGGATWAEVDHEAQAFGLATPGGLVSATGIGGLTLRGGLGWLSRHHGLSSDNLLSADLVTSRGELVRADAETHRELYWALRGGGGGFGVVTSFEYRLHPLGPEVTQLAVFYPAEHGVEVLRKARDFMADAPEELGMIAMFWSLPHRDDLPAAVRGAEVIALLGVHHGLPEEGERVIRPLRALARPLLDLSGRSTWVRTQRFLDVDYPDGGLYYWKSLFFQGLDDDAIAALARHGTSRAAPATTLDVWFLGGAVSRIEPWETAFATRRAPYMVAIESNWTDPAATESNIHWTRQVWDDLRRFSTGGIYLNFAGFGEDIRPLLEAEYRENYTRLRQLKQSYDPSNLLGGVLDVPG